MSKNSIQFKTDSSKMVHYVLSHSYMIYLGAIVFGVIFDFLIPLPFSSIFYLYGGFALMFLGTLLIYWAQETSSCSKKEMTEKGMKRNFAEGPYKYTRNPTHIGLSLLTLGFGLMAGSFFTVFFMVVAFLVTKFVFLRKEESLLEDKYGKIYCDYKKKVNPWL